MRATILPNAIILTQARSFHILTRGKYCKGNTPHTQYFSSLLVGSKGVYPQCDWSLSK